jgi:hypothetical protein
MAEDRVRDHRGRRAAVGVVDDHLRAPAGQHLDDRAESRLRQGVRVAAEEQRPVDPLRLAVAADGLGDRDHVGLVEGARRRAAAVAGGAERDALLGDRGVGPLVVVGAQERVDVDQRRRIGKAAGQWANAGRRH